MNKQEILDKTSCEKMFDIIMSVSFIFKDSESIQQAFKFVMKHNEEYAKSLLFSFMLEMWEEEMVLEELGFDEESL